MAGIQLGDWTEQEADETVQAIIKRSLTDMEFRQLVLSDPVAAVKQQTGKDLPEGFTIRVVDNAGANLTLVLPDPVDLSASLSDVDLEQVAGGGGKGTDGDCATTCGISNQCGVSKSATCIIGTKGN